MKIQPSQLNAAIRDIPLPDNMRELPVSKTGYPVPFFAGKNDAGEWDFRVVSPGTTVVCLREKLCWVCGQPMGRRLAFVTGPMCVITYTTAEPPSHLSCARYAAVACPFLASPRMKRNEKDMPEGHRPPPGIAVMRNPGVCAVLVTEELTPFKDGNGGLLIQMGKPAFVEWYAQRRRATRAEVQESIATGLPLLIAEADKENARGELEKYVREFERWLP